jgi:hexulose-6-phosphate isomerase
MVKFGVNIWSYSYPSRVSVEDALAHAAEVGYQGFEPALEAEEVEAFSAGKWERLKAKAEELRLEIPSISTGLFWQHNVITEPEAALRVLETECKAAKIVGAQVVLVVPGTAVPELDCEEHFKRAADWLRKAAPIAKEYGVKIGVENVWNRIFPGPLDFLKLLDMVSDESVGVYFDVGNTLPHSLPEHWIPLLGKRILQVHVKDYCITAGGLTRGFGIPLNGDVNWTAVRKALVGIDYEGYLLPEVPPYPGDPYKAAEDALNSLKKVFI